MQNHFLNVLHLHEKPSRIWHNLRNTGQLGGKLKTNQQWDATNENNEIAILAAIGNNPHASSRELARDSGISQRSVLRILKHHKFHPSQFALHQELYGQDFENGHILQLGATETSHWQRFF